MTDHQNVLIWCKSSLHLTREEKRQAWSVSFAELCWCSGHSTCVSAWVQPSSTIMWWATEKYHIVIIYCKHNISSNNVFKIVINVICQNNVLKRLPNTQSCTLHEYAKRWMQILYCINLLTYMVITQHVLLLCCKSVSVSVFYCILTLDNMTE